MTRLGSQGPARPLRNSHRALTGKLSLHGGGHAGFESSLERDWLTVLDFDPAVIRLQEQPFKLTHMVDGKSRSYTPDVLAEYGQDDLNWTVVYEVKHQQQLRADWDQLRPRYRAAVHHCRQQGWRFKIVTEKHIRTPYLENAKFLRRYRTMAMEQLRIAQLRYTASALGPTTPQALVAAAHWPRQEQAMSLTTVWHMLANGDLRADLHKKLTMSSSIWLPEVTR